MIKCEVCGNDLYDWECEEACWWCEMDANDPDPYVEYGGYKLYYTRTKLKAEQ